MMDVSNVQFPDWDTQLFLFLNGLYASWLDPVMQFLSAHWVWAPMYVFIAFYMVYRRGWLGLTGVLFLMLCFGLTDQLSGHLFKYVFQRFRPCHNLEIQHLIHQLEDCGGRFGFISNHAANTFGLAMFTSLFFSGNKWSVVAPNGLGYKLLDGISNFFRKRWYSIFIFVWAALVAYSRIYVGKHYPLDIICGAAFGMLIGFLTYCLYVFVKCRIINYKMKS